ncbi:hypothetical protein [Pedobacter sp. KBW06]|uniref:hypothetical protein n=1 Tax=Pedobacter sp. KBW06 TaxID=2153359 RepID=UPI000F5B54E4|nr:hypothetical protein [Pedobacter sp. KBW06]
MKDIKITRRELYNLVWEKPLTSLMHAYKISYLELKTLLSKHEIPLPPNGYWSKLKAGYHLPKTSLPKPDNEGDLIHYVPKQVNVRIKKEAVVYQEPVSEKLPTALNKLAADAQKVFQLEAKGKGANQLLYIGYQALNIRVSPSIIGRSIRFFNSLISMVERAGGNISLGTHLTSVILNGESIAIALREKQSRIEVTNPKYGWDKYDNIGSGILILKIGADSWLSKEWKDTAYTLTEDKLDDILSYLEQTAAAQRAQKLLKEQNRLAAAKQRVVELDLEKGRALELTKFVKLKEDAELWEKSKLIREYLNMMEKEAKSEGSYDANMEKYLVWARKKADWYDPLVDSSDELLVAIDKKTYCHLKKSFSCKLTTR